MQYDYWQAECRGYKTISDVAMWLQLLEKGDLLLFREPLSCYRRHAGQEGQKAEIVLLSRLECLLLACEYCERGVFLTQDGYATMKERLWQNYLHLKKQPWIRQAMNYAEYSEALELVCGGSSKNFSRPV